MVFLFRKNRPIFPVALFMAMVIAAVASLNYAKDPILVLRQYFESRGFKTGTITLPYLNVRVKLENNCFYRKEEGVSEVYQRINEIRAGFGLPPYTEAVHCCGWCGVVDAEYNGQKAYGYVVLVKKNLNPSTRIYTHAHENGHFLWYIGEQEKVYRKFKKPYNVRLKISTNDEFAELCGWLALRLAGYDLDKCTIQWRGKSESSDIDRIKKLVRDD